VSFVAPTRESAAVRLLGLLVRIPSANYCLSLEGVACCEVEVSVTGRSPIQSSPTECVCVIECDQTQ
jgi:hypothetical protein